MVMRFLALLLALCLPVLSFGESTRLLPPKQKQDLMKALDGVESYLQRLKANSEDKSLLIDSLQKRSKELIEEASLIREDLKQAIQNSEDSEASRIKTEKLLTEALKVSKESERLLKDYRFWSDVRFYSACLIAGVLAVLLVMK